MSGAPLDLPGDRGIERVLILKWSAMGDVVMSTAAMEDIHRAFPGRRIDLNAMPPWDRLFADDPRFERVFAVDLRGRERGLAGARRWLRTVREGRYDLVIDLQCSDRSRIMLSMLRAVDRRARILGNRARHPYHVAPADAPESGEPLHPGERLRRALAAGGIPARTAQPVLHPSPAHRERAAALAREHALAPHDYAVFLPGSQAAGHLKRWGAARYAALGRLLGGAGVNKVVLLGGPDERDECARIEGLGAGRAAVVNLCARTELLELVPLCEGARVVVANDTGTAHLAAATGRPLLVVCGPTDPRRVRPLGSSVDTLQADLPCINCYRKHCAHHTCMRILRPAQVLERLPL